jgi:hypothetical protein
MEEKEMSEKPRKDSVVRLALQFKDPANLLFVKLAPYHVNRFINIMEGFSHLAWVTTYDAKNGILAIITTPDTISEVRTILAAPPCSEIAVIVEINT